MEYLTPKDRKFLSYYQQQYNNPAITIGDLNPYKDANGYLDENRYRAEHRDEIFTNYYRAAYKDPSISLDELNHFKYQDPDDGGWYLDEEGFDYYYGQGSSWRKYGFDLPSSVDMYQRYGDASSEAYKAANPYADYEKYTPKQWAPDFDVSLYEYNQDDPLDMARARMGYAPASLLSMYNWDESEDVKRFKAGDMPVALENRLKGRQAVRDLDKYFAMSAEYDKGLQEWLGARKKAEDYQVVQPAEPDALKIWNEYLAARQEYEQDLNSGDYTAYDRYMGKGPKEPERPDFAYDGFEDDLQMLQDNFAQNRAINVMYGEDVKQERRERIANAGEDFWEKEGPIQYLLRLLRPGGPFINAYRGIKSNIERITGKNGEQEAQKKETAEPAGPTREDLAAEYLEKKPAILQGKDKDYANTSLKIFGKEGIEGYKQDRVNVMEERILHSVPSMEYVYRGNGKAESGVKWVYEISSGKWFDVVKEDPKEGKLTVSDNGAERDVYAFMVAPYEVEGENVQKAFAEINPQDHQPYKGEWIVEGIRGGLNNTLSGVVNAVRGVDKVLGIGVSDSLGLDDIVDYYEAQGNISQSKIQRSSKAGQFIGNAVTQAIPVLLMYLAGQEFAAPFTKGGAIMGAAQSARTAAQSIKSGVAAGRAVKAANTSIKAVRAAAQVAGRTPFFVWSFGSYYRQAEQDGATPGQSGLYGLTMATVETLTEMPIVETAFGSGLSKDLTGALLRSGASKFTRMGGAVAINMLFSGMVEGGQEVLAGGVGAKLKKKIYDPDYNPMEYDLEAMGQDFMGGAMMGIMFACAGLPSSTQSYKAAMAQYEKMAKGEGIDYELFAKMPDYLREDIQNMQLTQDIGKIKEAMAKAAGVEPETITDEQAKTFMEGVQAQAQAEFDKEALKPAEIKTTEELEANMQAAKEANLAEMEARAERFTQISEETVKDGQVITPNAWQMGEYTITQQGTGEKAKFVVSHPEGDDLAFTELSRAENYVLEESGALAEAAQSELSAAEPVTEAENPVQSANAEVAGRAAELRKRIEDPTDYFKPRMTVDLQFKDGTERVIVMDTDDQVITVERENGRLGNVPKDLFMKMITDESLVKSLDNAQSTQVVYNKSSRALSVKAGGERNGGREKETGSQGNTKQQGVQKGDGSGAQSTDEAGAQETFKKTREELISTHRILNDAVFVADAGISDLSKKYKEKIKKRLGVEVYFFRSDENIGGVYAEEGYLYVNETVCMENESEYIRLAAHELYHKHNGLLRKILGISGTASARQRRAYIRDLDTTDEHKHILESDPDLCTEEMEADLFADIYAEQDIKTYLDLDTVRAFRDGINNAVSEIRRVESKQGRGPPGAKLAIPRKKEGETVAALKKESAAQTKRAEKAERRVGALERRLDQVIEKLTKEALNIKSHYLTKEARANERRKESEVRKKLLKAVRDIKKLAPKMVPEFRDAAMEIVNAIDATAMSMTSVHEVELLTIKPAIEKLKAEYGEVYVERHILNQLERLDKIQIKSMDIEDVERMTNAVRSIIQEDRNWKKANTLDNTLDLEKENEDFYNTHRGPGGEEYNLAREKKKAEDNLIYNTLKSGALRGETMARRMDGWREDGPFQRFYKELTNGYRHYLEYQRDSIRFMEDRLGKLDQYKAWHGKHAELYAIDLETGKRTKIDRKNADKYKDQKYVVLDRGGIVALSLHAVNQDNLRHIVYGGVAISTTASKSRYPRKMSVKELAAVNNAMNAEERKVAAVLNEYFNEFSKPRINEISLLEDGYERATVENYFPIYTDRMARPVQRGGLAMTVLREMGMLKERTRGARSPIILENAFDVFRRHSDMVGQYVGMELPIAAFTKWFGQVGIQRALAANYSENDVRYWRDLFAYLDGNVDRTQDGFFTKMLNNFAGTVLGVNLGVMMKQLPSFITAFADIDAKYLAAGAAHVPKWKTIEKYSAEIWQRRRGYIIPEMESNLAKGRRWATRGIIAFDSMAIGCIWNAVEAETKAKRKNLAEGTDAFYEAVARRTEEIIHRTQPNFSPLYQPAIKRSGTFLSRVISLFSTQTNQNLNLLVEGVHDIVDFKTGKVKKTWKKGMKKLSGVVAASVMIALIQTLFRRIRHQDDEFNVKVQKVEEDRVLAGGKWYTADELDRMGFDIDNIKEGKNIKLGDGRRAVQRIARDTMGSLVGSVYFARDIYSLFVEKYDYAIPTSEMFNDLKNALEGSSKWSAGGHAVRIIEASSYFLGIPVENLNKIVKNSLRNIDYDMYAAYVGALTNEVPGDFYDDLWGAMKKGNTKLARQVASATWAAYENSAEDPKWSDFKGRIKSSGKSRGYSGETIREALSLFQ